MQHDVTIPDAQRTQLANLPAAWDKFQGVLEDAAASLDDAKENFREKVRGMVDTFGGEVAAVAEGFTATAPFSNIGFTTAQVSPLALNQCHEQSSIVNWLMCVVVRTVPRAPRRHAYVQPPGWSIVSWRSIQSCVQALESIKAQALAVQLARKKASDLKAGMDIFSIPQPPYKELGVMEGDLEKLTAIWAIIEEWDNNYSTWKKSKFKAIKVRVALAGGVVMLYWHYGTEAICSIQLATCLANRRCKSWRRLQYG